MASEPGPSMQETDSRFPRACPIAARTATSLRFSRSPMWSKRASRSPRRPEALANGMRSWRRLLSGARRRIQSTTRRAPHHDQDIVFDNRADTVVDYSRIRSREPAFATTLAEGGIASGVQVEVRGAVHRLQGVRGRSRPDAQRLRHVQ